MLYKNILLLIVYMDLKLGLCFAEDQELRIMVLRDVSKRAPINYVSTIQTFF
jgi:hypothetical protein